MSGWVQGFNNKTKRVSAFVFVFCEHAQPKTETELDDGGIWHAQRATINRISLLLKYEDNMREDTDAFFRYGFFRLLYNSVYYCYYYL